MGEEMGTGVCPAQGEKAEVLMIPWPNQHIKFMVIGCVCLFFRTLSRRFFFFSFYGGIMWRTSVFIDV